MDDDQLRISDAERERAAADLAEHYTQGRLSTEEHAERSDRVWAARTKGDLLPIFRDLPGPYGPPREAEPWARPTERAHWSTGPRPCAGRRDASAPVVVVLVVLLGITVAMHVPVFLAGLLVVAFVLSRHRRRAMWGRPSPR
ncbi:DUF1707 SHOCT-like domain-containing protein [Nocardioides guangzhouensis]|nr:DUF1707 domain-containing protein [Nocardioides guangzhouensis]